MREEITRTNDSGGMRVTTEHGVMARHNKKYSMPAVIEENAANKNATYVRPKREMAANHVSEFVRERKAAAVRRRAVRACRERQLSPQPQRQRCWRRDEGQANSEVA